MNDSITVTQATIEDLDEVAYLFDLYRIFYGQQTDIEGAKKFLFDRFEHQESLIYLARDKTSQEAVGFFQLYPSFSSVTMQRLWILNDLYVKETHRNKKVGKTLLDTAKRFAEITKSKGLYIATQTTNLKAQRTYQANGYVKDDEFYHYYLIL